MDDNFWKTVQDAGKYNDVDDVAEPWGFTWGVPSMDELRKGLATVFHPEHIDTWLQTKCEAFPDSPQGAIEKGEWNDVWMALYEIGVEALS